jgi:predicted secreted Zn-dependent protease
VRDRVRIDVDRRIYRLAGATAAQLRSVLGLLGPLRDGHRFGGYTDWSVRWRVARVAAGAGVRAGSPIVDVRATVTTPAWRPPANAAPELAAAFARYEAAVRAHEDRHVAIAACAGEELLAELDALGEFGEFGDAAALDREVELRARAVLERARAVETAYDRETEHGRLEGVVFPG